MPSQLPWHIVKQSTLHGTGVFAARDIPAGTRILEYCGARITPEEADAQHPVNPDDPFHTFYFSLSSGKVIDGGGPNGMAWLSRRFAGGLARFQSGYVYFYAFVMLIGLCGFLAFAISAWGA